MKSRGFTIVELLIVIVVIAILAAISIVAYNGIQQRAKNTQTITSFSSYAKALKSYYAVNQDYPGTVGAVGCFGKIGTACGYISGPAACNGVGSGAYETGFGNGLRTIATTLPEPSDQEITCGDGSKYKGILYVNYPTGLAMYAFLKGITQCPFISGIDYASITTFGDGYMCAYTLART